MDATTSGAAVLFKRTQEAAAPVIEMLPVAPEEQAPGVREPGHQQPRPSWMDRLREFWFGSTDLAPLGLFRIIYGLLVLVWLAQLWPDLAAFFADEGMLPRGQLVTFYPALFSLLTSFGAWWQVAAFWCAAVVAAVMLTVGYRTRLAAVLCFVALLSFQNRNPLMVDSSDFVFKMIAFWLAFTAAGDRYSIDAWLRKGRGQEPRTAGPSFPIRLLELQLAWIYLATGLEKWAGSSWRDGTANSYVFQLSHTFARPFVAPLASYSGLVRGFTWETLAVELAFLPLVFLPGPCRLIAVSGAALLQLGILAMLNVGNFPLIMLCMLILFLPAGAVSRLMRDGGPSPSPSPRGSGNWGRWAGYVGLAALAYAAFSLALPARFGMLGPPKPVRDALMFSGLDQSWNMFSPNPTRRDWSIVAPGQLSDGSEIEVLPSSWGPFYSRRMKILDYLTRPSYGDYLQEFGRSICRLRNNHLQSGQPQLLNFQITLVDRVVQAPGTTGPTVSEQVLWTHQCLS